MEKSNETKIVKYIHYYLKGFTYLTPLMFFAGYVGIILQFIKNGELIGARFSIFGVSFIRIPKEIIFGKTGDALIVLLFALILFLLFMLVLYYALKFVKNVLNEKLLVEQNGILLKIIGQLISGFAIISFLNELFLSFSAFNRILNTWQFIKSLLVLFPTLLLVLLQPVFVLGVFFILLGEILIRASIVKQENDLTV
ncbi:MAG: DUF2975 domain-containing protein [Ignavibacteriales bacterium]|nr:DUF2975 domain-containing protein [Ignavibacteriales bacterium]